MNTFHRPPLWLLTLLIMFPQPWKPFTARHCQVLRRLITSAERAAQTLSVYFVAFAVGVAMGLAERLHRATPGDDGWTLCYATGSPCRLLPPISAFAAGTEPSRPLELPGSVVLQTMLRDSYESTALSCVFSVMGAALALSPVFGLLSGGWLVSLYGHTGVCIALIALALLLLMLTVTMLPETRPETYAQTKACCATLRMARDYELWKNAILVALLNTMLFSYYSLAPFFLGNWDEFQSLWLTGLFAFASSCGSLLNQRLLTTGLTPEQLVRHACALAALSGLVAWCLQHSAWILIRCSACDCLWYRHSQCAESGAASLLNRLPRIVWIKLLPVAGNDAGICRYGATTGASSERLCPSPGCSLGLG
jgi:MFS family permease